jgi:SMODS-associating 2TM, beta-strand rich effector domain
VTFTRVHITAFVAVAAGSWWAALALLGVPLSRQYLLPFGTVVTALGAVAFALEHFLWYQPWLHGWFVRRPDLRGTWEVSIESDWVDPKTGVKKTAILAYMGVVQTLSKLQMHLMTPESESWFVAHAVYASPSESGYQVVGVYTNKPNVHLRATDSDMHFGAIVIDTHGPSKSKPRTLTAEYWTDRKTSGQMTLSRRVKSVYTRYEDARVAFSDAHLRTEE